MNLRVDFDMEKFRLKRFSFYQGFILPNKFNIDKRKLHFSNLIMTKQMSRDEALKELEKMPYESDHLLKVDKKFFLKRMCLSSDDFEFYLKQPRQNHDFYKSEIWIRNIKKKLSKIK